MLLGKASETPGFQKYPIIKSINMKFASICCISMVSLLMAYLWLPAVAAGQSPERPKEGQPANRVEILDFHNEHRCPTCLEIERLTRKILADSYAEELKKGTISFRLINADDKENLAIVRKYKAYGSTLIIRSVRNGKEEFVDLTNFAFMNFNKSQKFAATVKKEINTGLQRIKT